MSKQKTGYNVAGAVIGILLAGLAAMGIVQAQDSSQPAKYSETINYDD